MTAQEIMSPEIHAPGMKNPARLVSLEKRSTEMKVAKWVRIKADNWTVNHPVGISIKISG